MKGLLVIAVFAVVATFIHPVKSLGTGRVLTHDKIKSQRQKKSCSYPGCGSADDKISSEDQGAAMRDKAGRSL